MADYEVIVVGAGNAAFAAAVSAREHGADKVLVLEKADRVTLLSADPVEPPSIPPSEGIARLAWSGIKPELVTFDATQEEIGAAYLRHAGEIKADMLIKGAYARSRVRQMILGGRTRHIIGNTEIPVFLSH